MIILLRKLLLSALYTTSYVAEIFIKTLKLCIQTKNTYSCLTSQHKITCEIAIYYNDNEFLRELVQNICNIT